MALVCAVALTLGLIGHSQARGAKAVTPAKSIAYVLGIAQAGATQPPVNAACPYAAIVSGAVADHETLTGPGAEMRRVSYMRSEDICRTSPTDDTPLRPPRAA